MLDVDAEEAASLYPRKLVLSRPDQHVAWRGDEPPEDSMGLMTAFAVRPCIGAAARSYEGMKEMERAAGEAGLHLFSEVLRPGALGPDFEGRVWRGVPSQTRGGTRRFLS